MNALVAYAGKLVCSGDHDCVVLLLPSPLGTSLQSRQAARFNVDYCRSLSTGFLLSPLQTTA